MAVQDARATVVDLDACPAPYFHLILRLEDEAAARSFRRASPGQFVMAERDLGALEPYLRRAYSIFDVASEGGETRVELLGKVIGRGTGDLARARPGSAVRLLGPLGTGFALPSDQDGGAAVSHRASGRWALVAGGVGSAGLMLLARRLAAAGTAFDVLYGGRRAEDLALADRFAAAAASAGGELVATTEDGSRGARGLITAPLEEGLGAGRWTAVATCGPWRLMERVAELCASHGIAGQASLETPMGCGFGACLGCSLTLASGDYALCCRQGPVFGCEQVSWAVDPT